MDEENKSQQESAAGTIRAAAKTGKTISSIAKGAATGGMHGAALGAAKSSKKWIIGIVAVAILLRSSFWPCSLHHFWEHLW